MKIEIDIDTERIDLNASQRVTLLRAEIEKKLEQDETYLAQIFEKALNELLDSLGNYRLFYTEGAAIVIRPVQVSVESGL